jgi:hypothetical protein
VLFALAVSLTTSLSATAEQVSSVDLELVLCVDVLSSMSQAEQRLRREDMSTHRSMPQCCSPLYPAGVAMPISVSFDQYENHGPSFKGILNPLNRWH